MELIDVIWFTDSHGRGTIGLVKAKDGLTGEVKFYIGQGQGIDEDLDVASILAMGTKIHRENILSFFQTK